jgi:hypothetical protein
MRIVDSEPFRKWAEAMKGLLAELATQQTSYSFDKNELLNAASTNVIPFGALRPLYAVCGGLSLPDVHNGHFIDTADRMASAVKRGEPNQIAGERPIEIHVFGSDGGGSYFAVGTSDGAVYYLHSEGCVEDNVYFENDAFPARRVSDSVIGFLQRLLSDVEAFVHMREGHVYIEAER